MTSSDSLQSLEDAFEQLERLARERDAAGQRDSGQKSFQPASTLQQGISADPSDDPNSIPCVWSKSTRYLCEERRCQQ